MVKITKSSLLIYNDILILINKTYKLLIINISILNIRINDFFMTYIYIN